jgi:hypothetical protein
VAEAKLADVRIRLAAILDSVRFPVHRWQLVAAADYHGSDYATREALRDLSAETYPDPAAVVEEMARTSLVGRAIDSATGRVHDGQPASSS